MLSCTSQEERTVSIKIIETSDVHGCFMPYDFINQKPKKGSLARAYTYISDARKQYGDNLLLIENGDILQGQPIAYYYNFIATDEENIAASICNFMGYDAQTYGNHDIEPGHAVYDKWAKENKAAMVCANIIDTKTGKNYTEPYKVFEREGVKIAILGMITPAIPNWLSEKQWEGLRFENMVESTRKWVDIIKKEENPDIIIGLFHAGRQGGIVTPEYEENPVERIAKEIPGLDAIFYGHDHAKYCDKVLNSENKEVWMLNPSSNVMNVAELDITITKQGKKVKAMEMDGRIVDVAEMPVSEEFEKHFAESVAKVKEYTGREIGHLDTDLRTRDCFFGSCPFSDMINNIQLELTGADISFTAPLHFDATVKAGTLHVADMFNIYKFENLLCAIRLSGKEIKDYLEMSYAIWTNTMTSPSDHIMLLREETEENKRPRFQYPTFNFDSAIGIDYEVDVTKPVGEKVNILQMSDGKPFDMNAEYKVAINSYRANNGGELLTKGAKINKEDIQERIIWQSDKDLRYYLMQYIEKQKSISPKANNNWRFVPENWTKPAIERDRKHIFGE